MVCSWAVHLLMQAHKQRNSTVSVCCRVGAYQICFGFILVLCAEEVIVCHDEPQSIFKILPSNLDLTWRAMMECSHICQQICDELGDLNIHLSNDREDAAELKLVSFDFQAADSSEGDLL